MFFQFLSLLYYLIISLLHKEIISLHLTILFILGWTINSNILILIGLNNYIISLTIITIYILGWYNLRWTTWWCLQLSLQLIDFFILLLKKFLISINYSLFFAWSLFSFLGFDIIFGFWWGVSMRFALNFIVCLRNKVILWKTIWVFSLVRWTINSLRFWLLLFILYSILILMVFLRWWLTFLQSFITNLYRITFYCLYLLFTFNKYLFFITSTLFFLNLFLQTILSHIIGAINDKFIFTSILSWR